MKTSTDIFPYVISGEGSAVDAAVDFLAEKFNFIDYAYTSLGEYYPDEIFRAQAEYITEARQKFGVTIE